MWMRAPLSGTEGFLTKQQKCFSQHKQHRVAALPPSLWGLTLAGCYGYRQLRLPWGSGCSGGERLLVCVMWSLALVAQ